MDTPCATRRIHLTTVGSTARDGLEHFGSGRLDTLLKHARSGVGDRYEITCNKALIKARQNDLRGGREDDALRAGELEKLFADERVAAIVTLRGGGWFTRVLPRIDFDILNKRKNPLHLFGFSEMTSLIAIAGQYPKVVGHYDLGPCFLHEGLQQYALKNIQKLRRRADASKTRDDKKFAAAWASARYPVEFERFMTDVADLVDGKGSYRRMTGTLIAGRLPKRQQITVTGGNLAVMMPLLASPYAAALDTRGKWLAIEELNESPSSIDRMMAGLRLAGLFDRVAGILLGDFHDEEKNLTTAAQHILEKNLPAGRNIPIVRLRQFGHIWPIAPLPMHRELTVHCDKTGTSQKVTLDTAVSL